jgi:hypothetical protein
VSTTKKKRDEEKDSGDRKLNDEKRGYIFIA